MQELIIDVPLSMLFCTSKIQRKSATFCILVGNPVVKYSQNGREAAGGVS